MFEFPDRCALCSARALMPTDRSLQFRSGRTRHYAVACAFCGLLTHEGISQEASRRDLFAQLAHDRFRSEEDALFGLDIYTLRTAATLTRRTVLPANSDQLGCLKAPHGPLAAEADLVDLGGIIPQPLALGIICRKTEVDFVIEGFGEALSWAHAVVILADAPHRAPTSLGHDRIHLASRSLDGRFDDQRNALLALSPCDWMLQLDSDETLAHDAASLLGALATTAQGQGVSSIGVPRRNVVDGVLSDLYPDTQYRLNRRGVRYVGRVHERPDRRWQESMLSMHGSIVHRLDRKRVENRSRTYDQLSPGKGRLEEVDALLTPYQP